MLAKGSVTRSDSNDKWPQSRSSYDFISNLYIENESESEIEEIIIN